MQWLIDIIKEWVIAQAYATKAWVIARILAHPAFVDRGDPAVWDFDRDDFTADDTWYELDLSGIVPARAKAVGLRVAIRDNIVNTLIRFRKHGNTNETNMPALRINVANIYYDQYIVVPTDADRKIDYSTSAPKSDEIYVVVSGWWL